MPFLLVLVLLLNRCLPSRAGKDHTQHNRGGVYFRNEHGLEGICTNENRGKSNVKDANMLEARVVRKPKHVAYNVLPIFLQCESGLATTPTHLQFISHDNMSFASYSSVSLSFVRSSTFFVPQFSWCIGILFV